MEKSETESHAQPVRLPGSMISKQSLEKLKSFLLARQGRGEKEKRF